MSNFKSVYENPDDHRAFICMDNDDDFEGQNFDRKQSPEVNDSEQVDNTTVSRFKEQIERTISGFANASGGLLVIGVSKTGDVSGINHLTEKQKKSLLDLDGLRGALPRAKLHAFSVEGERREVALLTVEADDRTFCYRAKDDAAWIRRGVETIRLRGLELEQLKRDRKVVDFERGRADDFSEDDADVAVIKEFAKSKGYNQTRTTVDILRDTGAINGNNGTYEWSNAGILYFASNPRRVLSHAYLRLLRFECSIDEEDERPTPSFDRDFDGPLTKQIRDFRTFIAESGFFRTFEVRADDGGFVAEPEYPTIAVDEAVVNAIAHRDYASAEPIVCEKYEDAMLVRSPGRLLQQFEMPARFEIGEVVLESRLRNQRLMDWLRAMKDAKGAEFVKAIREGTRRMRDEMLNVGLPVPTFINRPTETVLILQNDIKRRTAKPTGLASSAEIQSNEFSNLYHLDGYDQNLSREENRERRRVFLSALTDKLEANDWIVDRFSKGRVTAHLRGSKERLPESLRSVVRLIPAYTFSVRTFFSRTYLAVDFDLQVQSVLTLSNAVERFDSSDLVGLSAFVRDDRGLIRARIVSINPTGISLRRLDTNDEFSASASDIFPSLHRKQLDKLVKIAAPEFDFARTIKSAALAGKVGAARERARRIGAVVETLRRDIFPVTFSSFDVALDARPLPILEHGDGKRALRAHSIREPEVEFSGHRSTANIREGITEYGSYAGDKRDIDLIGVVQPGFEQHMRDLVSRLQTGKFRFKGSERTFLTRMRLAQVSTANDLTVDEECKRLVAEYPEWTGDLTRSRVFLVHTPEADFALDAVDSPYYRSKRLLLEAGIPNQMVDSPTLKNPDYKDLNLALNIVAKSGSTPWVLPESIPDTDFFVGLSYSGTRHADVDQRVVGFANVFNEYGRWEFYSGGNEAVAFEDRRPHFERLVEQTLSRLPLSETPTICFHYSAKFGRADREAILLGAKKVCPKGRFVFIWLNSQHPVRLFDQTAGTDGSVARGRYVVGSPNQVYVSTTGYNQYRKTLGTPRPLEVNVYDALPDSDRPRPIDHQSIARQVLSLTKLNWASTDSLCGEPITIKYAKDIAYLTAAFQRQARGTFKLHSVLEKTPWFI